MFLLRQPAPSRIAAFLASQQGAAFTYGAVGATRAEHPPAGYAVDHNRVRLGAGAGTFERAVAALREWRMLRHGWASVSPTDAPQASGTTVAVVVSHYGFWSLNSCRIVYVLNDAAADASGLRRAGFAYGTLPEHGAIGEERFSVEWHATDDSVWFDLYAFSRPGKLLARLGSPFARRLQRRFARSAKVAMLRAVAGTGTSRGIA